MVELRRCVVSVGMVVGGRGAPWCCKPVGRRSRFHPCMPGWFGVGRLACGLFIVRSFSLQQFGWYMVVLAALQLACSLFVLSCCSRRRCSRMSSMSFSRLVLRFVAACLSDVAVIVLQRGCVRGVLLVRRRRSRQGPRCPEKKKEPGSQTKGGKGQFGGGKEKREATRPATATVRGTITRPGGRPARPSQEERPHANTHGSRAWRPPTWKGRWRSPHKTALVHRPRPPSKDGRYRKPDAWVTGSTQTKPPQLKQPRTDAGGTRQG